MTMMASPIVAIVSGPPESLTENVEPRMSSPMNGA